MQQQSEGGEHLGGRLQGIGKKQEVAHVHSFAGLSGRRPCGVRPVRVLTVASFPRRAGDSRTNT
ncbi:hypothetical protein GCM10010466_67690 [Planomonospora alba]|uniref:Uncharacterized protein n=1 Tax=Planomonospora alba TaxID=161354 RepID=A0ABP6PA34_9ACTN